MKERQMKERKLVKRNRRLIAVCMTMAMVLSTLTPLGSILGDNSITTRAEEVYDKEFDILSEDVIIGSAGNYLIVGNGVQTDHRIYIGTDEKVKVTLRDVNIKSSLYAFLCGGNTETILEGTNVCESTSYSGIEVSGNDKLIISGTGSITAVGSGSCAGIGSSQSSKLGSITINGGNVTAVAGNNAAGIGNGAFGVSGQGEIIINGGVVNATGGDSGAGIGAGSGSAISKIIINGGVINTTGGYLGAGIGNGYNYSTTDPNNIFINGGKITATGGTMGAGIGGGYCYEQNNIEIYNGEITAIGGAWASGIGGGSKAGCGNVMIYGGTISATGGTSGAGIGCGNEEGASGTVVIKGGYIEAVGGVNAAGIGIGGYFSPLTENPMNVLIENGTVVATGGEHGAGIGGGYRVAGAAVTIQQGTITATGGTSAAGIGGGCDGNGAAVVIDGGSIKATGYCDIGAGEDTSDSSIVSNTGSVKNSLGDSLMLYKTRDIVLDDVEGKLYLYNFVNAEYYTYVGIGHGNGDKKLYLYLPSDVGTHIYTWLERIDSLGNDIACSIDTLLAGDVIPSPAEVNLSAHDQEMKGVWSGSSKTVDDIVFGETTAVMGDSYTFKVTFTAPEGYYFSDSLTGDNRKVMNDGKTLVYTFDPVEVAKKDPVYTIPELSSVTYDPNMTLASISLPSGWIWKDGSLKPEIGTGKYSAIFTPADTTNYNTVESNLSLQVNKITQSLTVICEDIIEGSVFSPSTDNKIDEGQITYKYYQDMNAETEIETPTESGTYYMRAFRSESEYYYAAESQILEIHIAEIPGVETYNTNDYTKLKNFFNQGSVVEGIANGEAVNAHYSETNPLTWNGVVWSEDIPRRVVGIDWRGYLVSGNLDLSDFKKLTSVVVGNSDIRSLNVEGDTELEVVTCNYNNISKLEIGNLPNLRYFDCAFNPLESMSATIAHKEIKLKANGNGFVWLYYSLEDSELYATAYSNSADQNSGFLNWTSGDTVAETKHEYKLTIGNSYDLTANFSNYLIIFMNMDNTILDNALVQPGDSITAPEIAEREGYILAGWYTESGFTNPWNFETDKVTKNITLYPKWVQDISEASVSMVADQTYTGRNIIPDITVKAGDVTLVKGEDYNLSYQDNVNVGTARIKVTGMGNYIGDKTITFKINPLNAASCTILEIVDQIYTGSAITPEVTVVFGNKTLIKGTDYYLKYDNYINSGTASVSLSFMGNFTGTITKYYKIIQQAQNNNTKDNQNNDSNKNVINTYEVTFINGSNTKLMVKDGDIVTKPANPTKKGHLFKGWYNGTGQYDFTKPVTKNINLTAVWTKVTVRKATFKRLKNNKKQQVLVQIKAVNGCKGYEVNYSTDKKLKKTVKQKTFKKTSLKITGLKKNKTYYFKVRAYKLDSSGKKVYSNWGIIKKVKIKK